jgi:hypothetical protein
MKGTLFEMIITAIDPAGKGTTGVMLFCDTQN